MELTEIVVDCGGQEVNYSGIIPGMYNCVAGDAIHGGIGQSRRNSFGGKKVSLDMNSLFLYHLNEDIALVDC